MANPALPRPSSAGPDDGEGLDDAMDGVRLARAVERPWPNDRAPAPPSPVPHVLSPLSPVKRAEARALAPGLREGLSSVVATVCPAPGWLEAVGAIPALKGQSGAVVVFEAARLLRKYPDLNAFEHQGRIGHYSEVNVGFAIDGGDGLKAPVVHGADGLTLAEVAEAMNDRVREYVEGRLSVAAQTGGTFTVTDLSGEGATFVHPLILAGQSAILAVGAEPPGPLGGGFAISLAFDHRLAEGRQAARFLGELSTRLLAYRLAKGPIGDREGLHCGRCFRSLADVRALGSVLVRSVEPEGHVCGLCLMGA